MTEKEEPVTPERAMPASRRRVLVLVFGTLLFAVVANFVVLYLVRTYPTNGGHWLIRSKWALLQRAANVDTLVLGDSTCNQGVRPDVWRAQRGGTILNLCTIGDMLAVNDAWMLEEYLRSHKAPRRVVVVHTYDTWERDADARFAMLLGAVPLPFGFWRDFRVPIRFGFGQDALVAAGRWFPLYSDENSIRRWLTHPRETFHRHEGFQMTVDGYEADPIARPASVEVDARLHRTSLEEAWRPAASNAAALVALAQLAREHQIELVIAPGPIFEGLWQDARMQERASQIRRWIHGLVDAHGAHVLDDPPPTFPASQMTNIDHITDDAAVIYTTWLAERVGPAK